MMIRDLARERADAISRIGADAAERARAAGVPVYYDDPAMGGLVKEMLDGSRAPVTPQDLDSGKRRVGTGL